MAVQSGLRVEGAVVGNLQLVDGIVVDGGDGIGLIGLFGLMGLIGCFGDGRSQCAERKSHENTVKPNLVCINRLVPVDFVGNCARLVLQLLHHGLHGQQVFLFRPFLIHAGNEVTSPDVVEVIVQNVISADVALFINHGVRVFLAVLTDVLATITQVSVEHTLQLDSHDIAPFGFLGEVKHV